MESGMFGYILSGQIIKGLAASLKKLDNTERQEADI
jgi:hypothetical protein